MPAKRKPQNEEAHRVGKPVFLQDKESIRMKNLFRSMITSRYFRYFRLVVMVMLCLMIPVYGMAYRTFYNNAVGELDSLLETAVKKLDDSFFELCELNTAMQSNDLYILRSFSGGNVPGQTVYSARKVLKQLQNESRHMELPDLVFLTFRNNGIVVMPNAVYYTDSELTAMGLEPRFPNQDIRFYTVPDYHDAQALQAVTNPIYTNVSISAVYTAAGVQSLFGDLPVSLYLYDVSGTLILHTGDGAEVPGPEAFTGERQPLVLDGTHCTALGRGMPSTGMTLGICMPSSYIRELVRPILNAMIACFAALAAVGLGLSVFMAVYSAGPIRRLVRDTLQDTQDDRRVNELRFLLEMRDSYSPSLRDREAQLQEMMDTVRQMMRENYFLHLTAGAPAARDNEAAVLEAIPELCRPFRVALIEVRDGETAYLSRVRRALTRLGFLTVHTGDGRLAACVPEDAAERFRQAERAVREETGIRFSLSEPQTELYGVHRAYRALRYGGAGEPYLTRDALRQLESSLRTGETDQAGAILAARPRPDTDGASREAFEQLRALLRRIRPDLDLPFYEDEGSAAVQLEVMAQACLALARENARQLNARGGYKRQVLGYISENLGDPEMCVDHVAARFGISGRQVYGIVKDAEGVSFSEYLTQLRMKRAAELLAGQPGTVQSVAQACGYTSLNTFYKAFHRFYGYPPGQFGRGGESVERV